MSTPDSKKKEPKKKPVFPQGPQGQCCKQCRFYMLDEEQDYNDCRESSLQIINQGYHVQRGTTGITEGASFKYSSSWPRSHKLEWCGKFKPREEDAIPGIPLLAE